MSAALPMPRRAPDDRDPFAFGGANDDTAILSLFRFWIKQCQAADAAEDGDPEWEAALERRDRAEDDIAAIRAGTAIGLAVKLFLAVRYEWNDWTPSTAQLRLSGAIAQGALSFSESLLVSALRDAAVIVPEIGDLAAAVIHDDAVLIDADIETKWCAWFLATYPDDAGVAEVHQQRRKAVARINDAAAKTSRGEALKLLYDRDGAPAARGAA